MRECEKKRPTACSSFLFYLKIDIQEMKPNNPQGKKSSDLDGDDIKIRSFFFHGFNRESRQCVSQRDSLFARL